MAAFTVSSSPPTRRAYSESHSRNPLRSPLGHVTRHVTNHQTPPTRDNSQAAGGREVECGTRERSERVGRGRECEGSGENTEEEVDTVPNESSTTTDTLPEVCEPVDFIECGPTIPRAYSASTINGHHGHNIPRVIVSSGLQVQTLCYEWWK